MIYLITLLIMDIIFLFFDFYFFEKTIMNYIAIAFLIIGIISAALSIGIRMGKNYEKIFNGNGQTVLLYNRKFNLC